MSFNKQPLVICLLVALAFACPVLAAEGDRSFTFRVDTPPLQLQTDDDGSLAVRLEGFDTRESVPGAPDIPTRTVLVAIPPDAAPRLTIRLAGTRGRNGIRPRAVARVVPTVTGATAADLAGDPAGVRERVARPVGRVRAESPEIFEAEAEYPSRVAWLGPTGVLRDQRYVEVHVAPVRYDGRSGGLVIDRGVELTVHFDGAGPVAGEARSEPQFEPVYRKAFANYSQGRSFRLSAAAEGTPRRAPRAPAAVSSTGPIRRIEVAQDGIVRLDHALFSSEAPDFLASDPANWRLTNRGEDVPLQIQQSMGGNDAVLETGESVAFYGQALDDEPEMDLNYDNPAGDADLFAIRDFGDVNVYFLSVDASPQAEMTERDATPSGGTPPETFTATARVETDDIFLPIPGESWFWLPFVTENSGPRTETVPLPGLASGTHPADVRVRIRSFSSCADVDPDHETRVWLSNDSMQTLVLPADPDNDGNENVGLFDGLALFTHEFEWSHSGGDPELSDPVDVTLDAADMAGNCPFTGSPLLNDVILDSIDIDYQRSFAADGEELTFEWPDGDAEFEITGFADPAPEVYEITGGISGGPVVDAVRLTGASSTLDGSTYTVRFRIDNDPALTDGSTRRFHVSGAGALTVPAASEFEADRVSALLTNTTQADLLVIAHPDLLDSECSEGGNPCSYDVDCTASATDVCEIVSGSSLDLLLTHRASQGISARVARIGDVEDEFNDGLPGPEAIGNFLAWLLAGGWDDPPPSYVMLLGDGSYDYKGGTGQGDFVPTQIIVKDSPVLGYYSSDNVMLSVMGDDHLADAVPGRITARTLAEAEDILDKILGYEQSTPAGDWLSTALFMSDRGKNFDPFEAGEFEAMNAQGAAFVGSPYTVENLRYWSDNCLSGGCSPSQMKGDIKNAINGIVGDGAAMAQFVGHGNFDLWSDDVIFCANEASPFCLFDDTSALTNGLRLPWLLAHNCLTGGFHTPGLKSFGEQWLKRTGGGAVAVFAPSGLGFRFLGEDVTDVVWGDVYGPPKERLLAVPVLDSLVKLCSDGSVEGCQFYTLLGDPTTRLMLPHVEPATGLTATASTGLDAEVSLDWDPSATVGATYDVYRSQDPDGSYAKLNGSPVAGTSYVDDTVVATKTYFYYVVAVSGGFDSAWSNFNTDCVEPPQEGTPGPDCVQAQPLNLTPPTTPAGLEVIDAETGGLLYFNWDPVPEQDVEKYTVHYGPDENLGFTRTLLFVTFATFSGLEDGQPYYFAVEATNTSGTNSGLSEIVSGVPHLVLGLKSPSFIDDLRLSRDGTDAVLTWSEVSEDIYDGPTTIGYYEVYRDTTPDFVPGMGNLLGTTAVASYTDSGALSPALPNYHYLVRAVDVNGNLGGLGFELPPGIDDLELDRSSTPGNLVLSWPAAEGAGPISHYEVYAADAPFTRQDIRDGLLSPVVPSVPGTSVEIEPPAQNRYYSVLAVDVKGNKSPF